MEAFGQPASLTVRGLLQDDYGRTSPGQSDRGGTGCDPPFRIKPLAENVRIEGDQLVWIPSASFSCPIWREHRTPSKRAGARESFPVIPHRIASYITTHEMAGG